MFVESRMTFPSSDREVVAPAQITPPSGLADVEPSQLAPMVTKNPELLFQPDVDATAIAARLIEYVLAGGGSTGESIYNMHEVGLDSIMLYQGSADEGNPNIRIYYTRPGEHQLNHFYDPQHDLNCRPHDHRYPLAIIPLFGPLLHVQLTKTTAPSKHRLHAFQFTSAYLTGEYGLEHIGTRKFDTPYEDMLRPGDPIYLKAKAIHSITTYEMVKPRPTAWMVIEGPNLDKKPTLYSRKPSPRLDPSGLYLPVDKNYALDVLAKTRDKMLAGWSYSA